MVVLELKVLRILVDQMRQGIHLSRKPHKAGLITKETFTKVPVKYADFVDMFSPDLASKLPKHTGINNYLIDLNIQITCWRFRYYSSTKKPQ